ncbi:MAG: tetratricopeptide repeat protein [Oscillatoria princeps RMCB-10]|jgi:hypothetical protein|nr:tetratricopeptide repeat protein [Oscillatoria princeps RMCB-10]
MKHILWISAALTLMLAGFKPAATVAGDSPESLFKAESKFFLAQSDCDCKSDSGDPLGPPGGIDLSIPFIISPRNTWLLNSKPALRWNPVSGATRYTVRIEDEGGQTIWKTETPLTEIIYDGKPLSSEVSYLVIVETDKGASSENEKLRDLGFRLLNPDKAHKARSAVELLAKQKLTDDAAALAQAHVYLKYQLRAEAIDTLERAAAKESKTGALYQLLGDLYDFIGLNRLAESRYQRAVELAKSASDLQALATVQAALGEVYATRGDTEKAISWLQQALAGYKALANAQRVSELESRLQELNR